MSVLSVENELDYSAAEVELFAWCRAEAEKQAAAEVVESVEVKPDPAPEPEVLTHNVERFITWDMRAAGWLFVQLGLGTRDGRSDAAGRPLWMPRRASLWCFRNWPRFRVMMWILRSGKVSDATYEERWDTCNDCEFLKIDRKGDSYCGSCGCVDWRKSKLLVKNRCRLNHCPARKHPGPYIKLIAAQYPNREKQAAKKKPTPRTGGCGGHR